MWSIVRRAALLGAAFLLVAGGRAGAATVDVNVPFPFLVEGHQLPAGHYRIERDDMDSSLVLIRGEKGNNAAVYVLTTPAAQRPRSSKSVLTFSRYENQYRLSGIWNSAGDGREVPTYR